MSNSELSDQHPSNHCHIGIICALSAEARCFGKSHPVKKPVKINDHMSLFICGMGEDNARAAANILMDKNITALLSWGTAGGLSSNVHVGDLVLPNEVMNNKDKSYTLDNEWNKKIANALCHQAIHIHNEPITQSEKVLSSPEEKQMLHKNTHAVAVDMETFAIAEIAHQAEISCSAIRVIVDEANQSIPGEIINSTDEYGNPQLLKLLPCLLKNPGLINTLLKLNAGMKAASNTFNTIVKSQAI